MIDPRVMTLIAAISQNHQITISSLRSDHSMYTASGNVSNHFYGRAVDIAAIDGVPCTVVTPDGPCGRMARALALLPPGQRPTELIFCFDPDGPGPAFAAADHCDHIHAGYDDQGLGHGTSSSPRPDRLAACRRSSRALRDASWSSGWTTRRTTSWIASMVAELDALTRRLRATARSAQS